MMDETKQWTPYCVLSQDEMFARFRRSDSTSKHLLILYSMVIGTRAKVIVELGLGLTTGVLRTAAMETGGILYTCDFDHRRFAYALAGQDEHWKLYLEDSATFLRKIPEPFDFVMHDAAHHYLAVKRDLETIIPKMRKFGIICVHDTQQPNLSRDMLGAIRDATRKFSVSLTNLPFSAGLALIRVEDSPHPPIQPSSGVLPDGAIETELCAFPATANAGSIPVNRGRNIFTAAKIRVGHMLRQAGLKS